MTLLALALQIWVFAFVGFFGTELLATYPELRMATQVLFVLPLVGWAAWRLRGPRTGVDWAILGALAALMLVSLTSHDRQGSLESVGLAVGYALAFWLMVSVARVRRLRTAVAVGASYALIFWLLMTDAWWIQEKVAWIGVFGSMPNLESEQVFIWGTTNAFPILVLLAIPLLRWQPAGRPRTVLIALLVFASIVAIPLSQGRAGWLGLVAAAIAYDGLSGWRRSRRLVGALRRRRFLVPAGVLAAFVVLVVAAIVATRASSVLDAALDGRGELWRQAVAIFTANPITGGGPATYSWLRLEHVPDYTYPVPARLAHSVPLLTLADGGLLLALAFGTLFVTYIATARHFVADPRRRTGLAVLIGFAVASFFDDFSSLPAVLGLVVVIAAWTVTPDTTASISHSQPIRLRALRAVPLPLGIGLAGLLALPSVIGVDAARSAAAEGRDAAVAGNWQQAANAFGRATSVYGTDAGYWLGLGLADAELDQTDAARAAYARARDLSPGDARTWGGLAALAASTDERIALWSEAARRTVLNPTFSLQLGHANAKANRDDAALQAYAIAVALDRQLIHQFDGDPTLRASIAAEALVFAQQRGAAAALAPQGVGNDLALALGDEPSEPAWRAVYLAERGGGRGAGDALSQAKSAEPYSQATLRAAEAIARLTCDRPRYDAIASLIGPYRPVRPARLAIIRDHTYREDMLSSYLPSRAEPRLPDTAWPWSLIGDPPACPGWPSTANP